jgi:ribosomal protein S14
MLYSKYKDKKNRAFFFKNEKSKLVRKFLFVNLINNLNLKKNSELFSRILRICLKITTKKRIRLNSKTKLIRRCVVSNRNRSVLRPFGFSRIVFRNFIHAGILPGYKKAVW